MAAKKQTVTIKFITLEQAINHEYFHEIEKAGKINYVMLDNTEANYLNIPISWFGKEIVFHKERNQYTSKTPIVEIIDHEIFQYYVEEIGTVVDGTLYSMPIDVDGDNLVFDEDAQEFTCGCKTISLEEADQIFRYIGEKLGYTIT